MVNGKWRIVNRERRSGVVRVGPSRRRPARRSTTTAAHDLLFTIYHSLFTCLMTLAQTVGDAAVRDVDRVNFREDFDRAVVVAHLLVCGREVVAHRLVLVLRVAGRVESLLKPHRRGSREALLHEAVAE